MASRALLLSGAALAGLALLRRESPERTASEPASAAARVDLYLAAAPDEPLHLLHAVTQPGGGRRLTFGTGLVHTPAAVARLAGAYSLVQRTGDGATVGACSLQLGLTEYEFE